MKIRGSLRTAFALATLISGLPSGSFGAPAPRLDVTSTCRPRSGSDGIQLDEKRCRASEKFAQNQLVRDWTKYKPSDQAECTALATMGGSASYVELITCLELKQSLSVSRSGVRDAPRRKRKR